MSALLSICIPTYNRADCIEQVLGSIIPQLEDGVEVVVCDNGSVDNTEQIVEQYREQIPGLIYFKFSENQGVDRCFIQSIESATGKFCWLMGSDDKLEEGSVAKILSVLKEHPHLTGISVNARTYDATLTEQLVTARRIFLEGDQELTAFEQFFPSLFIYAGFLSGQVVRREYWKEIVDTAPIEQFCNCYVLVYIITSMIKKRPSWFYIEQPCVGYRADNDSFIDQGAYRRLSIDIVGFSDILSAWFTKDHPIYRATMAQVARVDVVWRLLRARLTQVEKGFWKKAFKLCWTHYAKQLVFWKSLFPFFVFPAPFWHATRAIYRATLKKKKLEKLQHVSS